MKITAYGKLNDFVNFIYGQQQQLVHASEKENEIIHEFYSFIYEQMA